MRHVIVAAALLGLTLSSAWADHGSRLSGEQIKEKLSGARVYLTTSRGSLMQVDYAKSGKLSAAVEGGYFSDVGKWWIDGDTYCANWQKIRNGETKCFKVTLDGDQMGWNAVDGSSSGHGKLVK